MGASCRTALTLLATANRRRTVRYLLHDVVQVIYQVMKLFFRSDDVRFGSRDLRLLGMFDDAFRLL